MKTAGMYGQVWERDGDWAPVPEASPARAYVNSIGQTLAGGIQRNIIAQAVASGCPEARADERSHR